jgi:hypothetical protein
VSRSITIGYRRVADGPLTPIDVRPPYYLLGTQEASLQFWGLPKLKEIGIARLSELGVVDPICFIGWDMVDDLGREIEVLHEHMRELDFYPELKAQWLSHLAYCYHLLLATAPKECIPEFDIG